jgi:hypothetical protein
MDRSSARVVLCLGADAFEAVTGLISWERKERAARAKRGGWSGGKGVGIEQWRGYLVKPSDCPPDLVTQTVPDPDNLYKAGGVCPWCRGSEIERGTMGCGPCNNTGKRAKGDPKPKKIVVEVPRPLPRSAQWIVGTYHPSFIIRMGRKPIPAFYNDVDRVLRALKDDLDVVDVSYETEVGA